MTARPPAVRIDDLANPRFPAQVADLLSAMAPIGEQIRLSPEDLLAQAAAETGLDDFGDDAFREPLGVVLRALEEEAGLSPMGRVSAHQQILQLLKNRLLIEQRLRRNPDIHNERIDRPIVIAGLPRTGTTHLHNLMSSDPALRSLPYWESLEPVLAEPERRELERDPTAPDPRLERCETGLAFINDALPYFKRMHEMTTWHVHEEIQLLALTFSTMLFETVAVMPTWRDWYKAHDQTPAYAYLKTILKVLQWSRGGTRWVLKSPQHLEQFGPLLTVFPDATVVVTHRDPVAVTASLVTMMSYLARLSQARVDPVKIGHYWAARVGDLLGACVRDRDVLPAAQSIDVRFHEFMADDVAMVERIYRVAGQPMSPEARAAMHAFMREHPRGRHGGVHYDLADFELDPAERRAALRFYAERFGVEDEARAAS